MIDMSMAEKNISRWRGGGTITKLLAERNDSRAGIEDQPAPVDSDLDARSIATDAERGRVDRGIAAAHAPKFQPEVL